MRKGVILFVLFHSWYDKFRNLVLESKYWTYAAQSINETTVTSETFGVSINQTFHILSA